MSRIGVRVRTAILCAVNTLLPVAQTGCPRVDPSAVLERMALLLWSSGPWRTLGAGYTTVFQNDRVAALPYLDATHSLRPCSPYCYDYD